MYTSLDGEQGEHGFFSRYKKPLIFLASVAAIVGIILIIVFVLLDHTGRAADDVEKYDFTFDSIFNTSLNPKSFNLRWDADGLSYVYQDPATLNWNRHDLNSTTSSLLVNETELQQAVPNYAGITFSADKSLLLVSYNVSSIWRHSFVASYKVFNVATKAVSSLVAGDIQVQNVVWNPVNHQVAYVYENNIYIVDAANPNTPATAVTSDGDVEDGILNGIQSWVYEEEVFSQSVALWWSPDGKLLAYLRFDESEVPIFYYTLYNGGAYTTQVPLRYPKAGYTNPEVELRVYDSTNSSSFPSTVFGHNQTWEYIASVQWDNNNGLWVQTLNRYQNFSAINTYSLSGGAWSSSEAFLQTSARWVEVFPVVFCNGYNLTILPNEDNFHIASIGNKGAVDSYVFLTGGKFDVSSIAGCGADGKIFYHATPAVDSANPVAATLQHIYTLNPSNAQEVKQVNTENGVFSASTFSPTGNHFVINYLGPDVPKVFLLSTDLASNVTLEDNKIYEEIISHYDFAKKVYTTVENDNGDIMNAYYKTPSQEGDDGEYPLLIDVYAGPNTQKVQQIHKVGGLDEYLATKGYVLAAVDGRGTGRRGLKYLQDTYRQLFILESADQRAGARELAKKIKDVNDKRVGIWGWSYGGGMAAHGIAGTSQTGSFQYKAAVSVAPGTDWRFYDTVYTERYMSTPADNPAGYNTTSIVQRAAGIPNNKLLLMAGTADDNVHFQNTVELVNALINSNVQFETMFYPNDNHAINNGNARRYLYTKLAAFLDQELKNN